MHGNPVKVIKGLVLILAGCLVTVNWLVGQTPQIQEQIQKQLARQGKRGQSQPNPVLLEIFPSGGQAGTSFEVTVTGLNLGEPEGLYFSVPGVKSEYLGTGSVAAIQPTAVKKKPPKMARPQNSVKFKVTLPRDVRPGIHDVRVITAGGISNPRAFAVGDLKEFVETESNDDVPQAQHIELNSTVSGVISAATDVDYFQFSGKKGQRVVASCLSTSIDSKLPASIELYGSDGNYLGSGRGYQENDALADCVLPADGDYLVRVASFTYTQGGPDYFYRLTVSTAPWIDAVFPPAIESGKTAEVSVYGRNLPGGKLDPVFKVGGRPLEKITLKIKAPADPRARQRLDYTGYISPSASGLDGFDVHVRNEAGQSNPALVTIAEAPVILDQGDNDTAEKAQPITLPCEIAGWIEKKADRDWFVFEAKKGEVYSIELKGDRLGSPLDLYLSLRDARGRTITEQDDGSEILSQQFYTRSYDPPRYRFVAPADGEYRLMVSSRDAFVQTGPRHRYLVRIGPERPDFRLLIMPAGRLVPPNTLLPDAAVVGQGGNQALQVFVWRRDGFNSDITLTARDLPPGITLPPQVVPPGQKQSFLVFSASPQAAPWTGAIRIEATAVVHGRQLVREARSASLSWPIPQVNIPAISRLDRSLVLAVRDKAPFSLTAAGERLAALPGGKISIPIKLTRHLPDLKTPIQISALSIPPGLTLRNLTLPPGKDQAKVEVNVKPTALPGTFTLVLRGQTQGPVKMTKKKIAGGISQPSTPITITILPRTLAKLTVSPQSPRLPLGKEVELRVKVNRLFDFDGPFKLEMVLPKNTRGIQATQAEIVAGKTEARLILSAPAGTPLGNANITIRAIGRFHGHDIVQEAKVSVAVVKGK